MEAAPRARLAAAAAISGVLAAFAALVLMALVDARLRAAGQDQATQLTVGAIGLVVAMLSSVVVGAAVAVRRPTHPVGWLFLGLGVSLAVTALLDSYASYGLFVRPGRLPGADLVAVFGNASFITLLVLLTWILLLTPTGRPPSPRWGTVGIVGTALGGLQLLDWLLSTVPMDAPYGSVRNPLGLSWASPVVDPLRPLSALGLALSVVTAALSLVVRFRSSEGVERRQLRWVTVAALTIPFFALGTVVAAESGHVAVAESMVGGLLGLLPVAAGLAVMQYHLYDVDRVLSRALTYLLLTSMVALVYAVVVVATGRLLGHTAGDSQVDAVVATLAAISVVGPLRHRVQRLIDRRFNRRQFEAVEVVRSYVREPSTALTVEDVLRDATGDRSLAAAYWIDDRARWVTQDGRPLDVVPSGVSVRRRDTAVACVTYDDELVEPHVAAAVIAEATVELENARHLAALSMQLVEVRQSRSRIVAAQLEERRRIERNLHDGAQQRLLALALQLRAAEVSGDAVRAPSVLDAAVEELQRAIGELRDLANGLHPSVLVDGGLAGALYDLAARTRTPVRLAVVDDRFPPDVETTAWFVACEAIANAIKHARATTIEVTAAALDGHLVLSVRDDGTGGADPSGTGLRGIADRAEAIGGRLVVAERSSGGTLVEVSLPCGS